MFLVVPCKKESLSLIKARQGHSDLICSEINRSFFSSHIISVRSSLHFNEKSSIEIGVI